MNHCIFFFQKSFGTFVGDLIFVCLEFSKERIIGKDMFAFSNLNLIFSSLTLCYFSTRTRPVMSMRPKNTVCLFQDSSRIVPKAS